MYHQQLLENIEQEIKICKRLYTKIPPDKIDYRPKEGVRSILELLQYLSFIGAALPTFWLKKDGTDFHLFFEGEKEAVKDMPPSHFLSAMDRQTEKVRKLFDHITDEELLHKRVAYPWGGTAPLGQAIIEASIKLMAAYKLQLFLFIKLSTEQNLTTADAWVLTDMP